VAFADVHREVGDDHSAHRALDFGRASVAEFVEFAEAATAATTTTTLVSATTVTTAVSPATTMATAATTAAAVAATTATASAAMTASAAVSAVSRLGHILLTQRFSPDNSRAMATRTLEVLAFTRAELQRHTVFPSIRCNNEFPSTFTPETPAATVAYGYFTAQ
jgi:hypothetical protein